MVLVHVVAHIDPAGGAPTKDLIPALFVGMVALMALGLLARAHRSGRSDLLRLAARQIDRMPGPRGLPTWSGAPVALTAVSLATAVFGFYWDVSTHIDNGRDPGPFANPA